MGIVLMFEKCVNRVYDDNFGMCRNYLRFYWYII